VKLSCRAVFGNYDQIPTDWNPAMQAHPLSNEALDPFSNDRISHFLRDRQPEPSREGHVGAPASNGE